MKTRTFAIIVIMALLPAGCFVPKQLPLPEDAGADPYGSVIRVTMLNYRQVRGELLAADTSGMIILPMKGKTTTPVMIRKGTYFNYRVYYARPKDYRWTIPLSALISVAHGWFLVFTLPANLLVTSMTTAKAAKAFSYNQDDLSPDQLGRFSRYPQGLPPDITWVEHKKK
jgi:hypothetical protein